MIKSKELIPANILSPDFFFLWLRYQYHYHHQISSTSHAVIQAAHIPAYFSSYMNHVLASQSLGNDAELPFYKLNISLLLSGCPGRRY